MMLRSLRPLIRTPQPGRRFFSALKPWRSFEGARDWARSLGIQTTEEWQRLGPRRPADVPAEPWRVYPEYIDSRDWLGYKPAPPPSKERFDTLPYYADRQLLHRRGVEVVGSAIRQGSDEFEICTMPYFSPLTFLFRPKHSHADAWAALAVRAGANQHSNSDRQWFCIDRHFPQHSWPPIEHSTICYDGPRDDLFFFRPGDVRCSTVAVKRGGRGKYDGFHISSEDLPDRVRDAYGAGPLRSIEDWLLQSPVCGATGGTNMLAIVGLWRLLWRPCDLAVRFSVSSDHAHSLHLASIPIVLRTAAPPRATDQKAAWSCKLHRSSSNRTGPFTTADDFSFALVVFMRSDTEPDPRGCFLFPKRVLASHGKISSEGRGGTEHFLLYPPWVSLRRNRGSQIWQTPYYIDLSDRSESALAAGRDKFLAILGDRGSDAMELDGRDSD